MGLNRLEDIEKKSKKEDAKELENKTSISQLSFAEEHLENLKQDRLERKKYAKHTFIFLSIFTFLVLFIVFLSGLSGELLGWNYKNFILSDTVLITLITTSLATIVGIFAFVMKYLFYKK